MFSCAGNKSSKVSAAKMSSNNNNNNNNSRNPYVFPDFSLRRLLLQGARAARGSPQLGTRLCDVERGTTIKHEKGATAGGGAAVGAMPGTSGIGGGSGSNKVSAVIIFPIVIE